MFLCKHKAYGIVAESLTNLNKEIDDFEGLVAKPRSGIVARSTATARLIDLFKETNELLREQLDKLMLVLKESYPTFYNEYKAARIIVDLHGSAEDSDEAEEPDVEL